MARLRNRIVKAEFWTDGELLRWPRDKRTTYQGLWALAEDSGCLEDDPFTWKLMLWPSPVDADITVKQLETWRDELIAAGKMIPYEAEGKTYLYLTKFHQHEHPRNPQRADLPLPAWIVWEGNQTDPRKGQYREATEVVQALNNESTSVPVLSCPAQPCPALPRSYNPMSDETSDPPSENGSGASSSSSSPSKQMAARPDKALEIFTYWQAVMNHPKAKFTPERRRKVEARLKQGYSVEDLKKAIDGCHVTPHNLGQNEAGTVYDDLELICRYGTNVERFMANGTKPKSGLERLRAQYGGEP